MLHTDYSQNVFKAKRNHEQKSIKRKCLDIFNVLLLLLILCVCLCTFTHMHMCQEHTYTWKTNENLVETFSFHCADSED